MPPINRYGCTECEFELPTGWGGYTYAVDERGKRRVCPHPGEFEAVFRITGLYYSDAEAAGRVGFNKHCVCMTCLAQFDLDTERDDLVCEKCKSTKVVSANQLVGKACPRCSKGTIEKSSPIRWRLDADWETLPVPDIVKDLVEYHNTREASESLMEARRVADEYGEHNFFIVTCRLLEWWEGDFLGETEEEMEQQDSAEMKPGWTWCKSLTDVLDSTPALARLVVINDSSCSFSDAISEDERRGIKNYLRKYMKHSVWS